MRLQTFLVILWPLLGFCCEDGWTRYEKKCYKTFSEPNIQNSNTNDFCKKHGATLSSVLTDSERRFLVDFTTTGDWIYDERQVQIGAYRESHLHPWKWYDGSPFTQLNFFTYPSEPTNKQGEFYMALMGDKYSASKPFGAFIDQPLGPAYLFVCKKNDTVRSSTACDDLWTSFGGNCYRRFSESSLTQCADVNRFCGNFGATLTSVLNDEERKFIIEYSRSGRPKWDRHQTYIGAYRASVNSPWQWFDGTPFTQHNMWLSAIAPSRQSDRICVRIKVDEPSHDSHSGIGPYGYFFDIVGGLPAYVFVCKKKGSLSCDSKSMDEKDGKCVCKPEFIDIVDSDFPEAKDYSRGQKCIKKGKCHTIKDSTSILFIIDSSESITEKHWPKMVNFVKSGAKQLPSEFRVGFMKFSDKVSEKKWLKSNWTPEDYRNAVPAKYEKGQTNTPLALQEARKMFKNDGNENRIAVLITDGMPIAAEYESQEDALKATLKAARALQKEGVRLTVMGVGPGLISGIHEVKEWVKNPRKDYFSFTDTVDCLKESDMDNLLQIVCDSS